MNKNEVSKHSHDAQRYLEQTADHYVINVSSGLYEPSTSQPNHRRSPVGRPKATWADLFANSISVVGVLISLATLIGLGLTIWYSLCQLQETRRTADASIKSADAASAANLQTRLQFIQDQRPYVAETANSAESPTAFASPSDPGEVEILWNWHMTNYGKTPARKIELMEEMRVGGGKFVKNYKNTRRISKAGVLPPTVSSFDSVLSPPLPKAKFDELMRKDNSIEMRVTIRYWDAYGLRYETGICLLHQAIGPVAYCREGNYLR